MFQKSTPPLPRRTRHFELPSGSSEGVNNAEEDVINPLIPWVTLPSPNIIAD